MYSKPLAIHNKMQVELLLLLFHLFLFHFSFLKQCGVLIVQIDLLKIVLILLLNSYLLLIIHFLLTRFLQIIHHHLILQI